MTTGRTDKSAKSMDPGAVTPKRFGLVGFIFLIVVAVVLGFYIRRGIHTRVSADADLKRSTEAAAVLVVNVTNPKPGAPTEEVTLPGSAQPFVDAPIYARATGYLKLWNADIGVRVKRGDLLAEIETPEIDQQLQQSRADLETAKANLELAKSTANRLQGLVQTGSVSQQETDVANGDLAARKAIVDSSMSNVRRLENLVSFEKVYAPFDGVITARNTDVGALIDAGANAPGKELFHLASITRLRVFVSVPETFSRAAVPGTAATLTLEEYPGEVFHGKLARTTSMIDTSSSTLRVEVDVDNPSARILPGAFVFVHLPLSRQIHSVTIPANTLLFRKEGLRVAVVKQGRAELVPVTIGRDYGDKVEIVSGLEPADNIILDPPDSLTSGVDVKIKNPAGSAGDPHR